MVLVLAIETDVHDTIDATHPFPLQGDPVTLNKCITLIELFLVVYEDLRTVSLQIVPQMLRVEDCQSTSIMPLVIGDCASFFGPSRVAVESILSTARLNDPDTRGNTINALQAYVAARLAAAFFPPHTCMMQLLQPVKSSDIRESLSQPCPVSIETAMFIVDYLHDELQLASGGSTAEEEANKDPPLPHSRRSFSVDSFERQQSAIGRLPAHRLQWVLQHFGGVVNNEVSRKWGPLTGLLLQVVSQFPNIRADQQRDSARKFFSCLTNALVELGGFRAAYDDGEGLEDAILKVEALCTVAKVLDGLTIPISLSSLPAFASICESMMRITKASLARASGDALISRILDQQGQTWPLQLADHLVALLVTSFLALSREVRQQLAVRVARALAASLKQPLVYSSNIGNVRIHLLSSIVAFVPPGDTQLGIIVELLSSWMSVLKGWSADAPLDLVYEITCLVEAVVSLASEEGREVAKGGLVKLRLNLDALLKGEESQSTSDVLTKRATGILDLDGLISKGLESKEVKNCFVDMIHHIATNPAGSHALAAPLYMALWRLMGQLDPSPAGNIVMDNVSHRWRTVLSNLACTRQPPCADSLLAFNTLLRLQEPVPFDVLGQLTSAAGYVCATRSSEIEPNLCVAVRFSIADTLLSMIGRGIKHLEGGDDSYPALIDLAPSLLEVIDTVVRHYRESVSALALQLLRRSMVDIAAVEEDEESRSIEGDDMVKDNHERLSNKDALAEVEQELLRLILLALSIPPEADRLSAVREKLSMTHPCLEDLLTINDEGEKPSPDVKADPDAMMLAPLDEEIKSSSLSDVTCLDNSLNKHVLSLGGSEQLGDIERSRRHLICSARLLTGLIQPMEWLTRSLSQAIRKRKSTTASAIPKGGLTDDKYVEARDRLLDALATLAKDPMMLYLNPTCLTLLHRLWAEAGVRPRTSVMVLVDSKRSEIAVRILTECPHSVVNNHDSQWGSRVSELTMAISLWALQELAGALNSKYGQPTLLSLLAPKPFFPLWASTGTSALAPVLHLFLRGPENGWSEASVVAGHMLAWAVLPGKGIDAAFGTGLAGEESLQVVRGAIRNQLQCLDKDGITRLISTCLESQEGILRGLAWDFTLLIYVLCDSITSYGRVPATIFEKLLFEALMDLMPRLLETSRFHPLRLLDLACLLAAGQGKLCDMAVTLLESAEAYSNSLGVSSTGAGLALSLELLAALMHARDGMNSSEALVESQGGISGNGGDKGVDPLYSKVCSYYRMKGEFADQHWYNCFTCDLKWEEGCCSACSRICHDGHDVAYASFSNFLCDCGGDTDTSTEGGGGLKCQCSGNPGRDNSPHGFAMGKGTGDELLSLTSSYLWQMLSAGDLSLRNLVSRLQKDDVLRVYDSLPDFLSRICRLSERLISLLWKQGEVQNLSEGKFPIPSIHSSGNKVSTNLTIRPASLQCIDGLQQEHKVMLHPLRLLEQGSLDVKINQETSRGRQFKALIMSGHVRRNVLSADGQGRVAVVEQEHIIIANSAPLLVPPSWTSATDSRTRLASGAFLGPTSVVVDRSRLCVLSKTTAAFQVLGVLFNPLNNNHLAVWGLRDCMVLTLDVSGAVVEKHAIDASYDTVTFNSGIIKQVRWVPGSDVHLCIVSDSSIKIFDFTLEGGHATHSFLTSAADPTVIDATLVPKVKEAGDLNVPGKSSFNAVLVVMTKSCKLFALPLEAPGDDDDNDGILESRIEAGQTLLLPDEYASVEEGIMAMHYSESFGYLLISYEDETVVAVKLNPEVTHIERAFPLFTTAILATCSSIEEASIPSSTGPYNRFVDCPGLEMVLMVARVNRQRTERVVALRVAEDRQRNSLQVQQPRWRVNQDVMGGPSHTSSLLTPGMIEGMCGGPLAMNTTAGGVRSLPPTVLVLYENGSMQIFSDRDLYGVPKFSKPCGVEGMTMATNGPSLSSCITHLINNHAGRFGAGQTISEPSICTAVAIPDVEWEELEDAICMQVPHVTALESLINVTHWKDLMIYAEPFSSFTPEHLRQKLNQDNDEFVVSPRSEGFSMGLRLKTNEMELAAIRILVGNTSLEFIPRELRVMGRTCATCKGLRRWYDLLLSEEEIRLVRETGLLAFSISNSFEHDNPAIIDALEVYARRRSPIANTSPSTWHGERDKMVVKTMITGGGLDDATRLERSVVGCTQVLQEACRAVGPSGLSESMRSQILAPLSLAIGKTLATKYLSEENMKPSQRRARAVRAAAKKVLTCLLPSPGQYQRLKDSIHLENCKMILTSPSQLASSEDLQVSVCVGLKIMSKRPENMLGKDGILLEGLAPYCLESMLGIIRSGIEGLSTMTTVEQLVGDVTELGLREISYRIEANSDIAVIREVLPYLMLLTDSCEQVSSACAVRLIHILNAPSFILSPPAKNAFGNSKVTSAVVDPLTLPQPELSPAEDCIGNEVEYRCDGCDKYPLQNFRWHCKVCEDFDLCETCHGDPDASWDESVGHMPTHGMTRLEIGNALERPSNVTAVSTGAVDGEPQSRTAPMDVESDVRKDSAYKELKSAGCSLVDNLWAAVYECVLMRLQEFLNTSPQQEVWRPQQMVNHLNVAMALATDNARFERLCPLKDILGILAQGFCFHVKQLHQEVETEGRSGNLISRSPRTDWVILLTKTIECLHSLLAQRAKQSIRERSKYLRKAPNCRDHKAPTCLRIWPRGKHQGRRFYMCSLPKESRCSYFRWLDKGTSQGGASCDGDVALALIIGFSETLVSSSGPKAESKGVSVERLLSDLVRWGLSSQSARTNSLDVQRSVSADLDLRTTWPRPSLPSSMESHQKQWAQLELMLDDPSATIRTSVLSLLAASLKVLRRAREKNSQDDPQKQPAIPFSSDWIRLLCDIIGRQDDGVVRQMAKKVLRLLCASRTEYQRVRDLHLFSRSLLSILKTPEVRANAGRLSVSKLRYEIQLHLYSTLSAMCKVAESRRGSWRAFCCHPRFPLVGSANDVDITSVPPISYVYDLCLSLEDGELHSRFLRLL